MITASERNSDFVDTESTTDGKNWKFVDQVKAAGTSTAILHYYAKDFEPDFSNDGIVYYRLKMVDFDGSYEYSTIRSVKLNHVNEISILTHPNPTSGSVSVDLDQVDWSLGGVSVDVYNPQGERILADYVMSNDSFLVDLTGYPQSIYLFQFSQEGETLGQFKILKTSN